MYSACRHALPARLFDPWYIAFQRIHPELKLEKVSYITLSHLSWRLARVHLPLEV